MRTIPYLSNNYTYYDSASMHLHELDHVNLLAILQFNLILLFAIFLSSPKSDATDESASARLAQVCDSGPYAPLVIC